MAALNTPGLNRWQQMQTRPFGTNTTSMGPPDPGASAYKRMAEDYGRALRETRRLSRRSGDPRVRAQAALQSARIGQEAINQGVSGIQGIRQAETQRANERGFSSSLGQAAAAQEAGNRAAATGVQGIQGIRKAETQANDAARYERRLGQAANVKERANVLGMSALGLGQGQGPAQLGPAMQSDTVNPSATAGAGRGTPLGGGGRQPRLGWDSDANGVPDMTQRPEEPAAQATSSQQPRGDGLLARNRTLVAQRGFLDRVKSGLAERQGEITQGEFDNLRSNARRLGLDEQKFLGFLDENIDAKPPQGGPPKATPVKEVVTNQPDLDGKDAGGGKVYRYRKPGDQSEGITDRMRLKGAMYTMDELRDARDQQVKQRRGDLRLADIERKGGLGYVLGKGTDWSKVPRKEKIDKIRKDYGISQAEAERRLDEVEKNVRRIRR